MSNNNDEVNWSQTFKDGKTVWVSPSGKGKKYEEEGMVVGATRDKKHYYVLLSSDFSVIKIARENLKN